MTYDCGDPMCNELNYIDVEKIRQEAISEFRKGLLEEINHARPSEGYVEIQRIRKQIESYNLQANETSANALPIK